MTSLDHPLIRAQIARALRQAGAKTYEIVRTPTDANGQPNGEPATVGQLYAVSYIDPSVRSQIHIDLPGMIARHGDTPVMTALRLCGEDPQAEDTVRCGTAQTRVLSVVRSGPLHTLTTEAVI